MIYLKYLAISAVLLASVSFPVRAETDKKVQALPIDDIQNFVDVYDMVKKNYVEEKTGKTLIHLAIEGMINGLDPHSAYFKKSQVKDFKESMNGSYMGFGFQLDIVDGQLIIVSPIADSPAEKAGLKPNDIITKIDHTIIRDMTSVDIDKLLKGKDKIILTVLRKNEKPQVVHLKRGNVNLPSINAKKLAKNYGYIRITQFQENSAKQFKKALKKQLSENIKGLIIDLRNNPGGLVEAATMIADDLLDGGLIVSTKNLNNDTEDKVHAQKATTITKDLPLVVLINHGSASASELLAGALQDHKRAIIVGQTSFGKGSVQTLIHLSNGDAIKLTTARYYTPNGQSIQAKGITPDIELSQLTVDDKKPDLLSYGEVNISGHLPPAPKATEKKPIRFSAKTLAKSDLQLFEALNILKVMVLTQ